MTRSEQGGRGAIYSTSSSLAKRNADLSLKKRNAEQDMNFQISYFWKYIERLVDKVKTK